MKCFEVSAYYYWRAIFIFRCFSLKLVKEKSSFLSCLKISRGKLRYSECCGDDRNPHEAHVIRSFRLDAIFGCRSCYEF